MNVSVLYQVRDKCSASLALCMHATTHTQHVAVVKRGIIQTYKALTDKHILVSVCAGQILAILAYDSNDTIVASGIFTVTMSAVLHPGEILSPKMESFNLTLDQRRVDSMRDALRRSVVEKVFPLQPAEVAS